MSRTRKRPRRFTCNLRFTIVYFGPNSLSRTKSTEATDAELRVIEQFGLDLVPVGDTHERSPSAADSQGVCGRRCAEGHRHRSSRP
ncbi:hypothetical protein BURKHO8Y_70212 [Burkholderia sp. 8Y]|nr:hypothetical protein BURKHO8Y_70212 [Burkholderia sp. 8Y]